MGYSPITGLQPVEIPSTSTYTDNGSVSSRPKIGGKAYARSFGVMVSPVFPASLISLLKIDHVCQ